MGLRSSFPQGPSHISLLLDVSSAGALPRGSKYVVVYASSSKRAQSLAACPRQRVRVVAALEERSSDLSPVNPGFRHCSRIFSLLSPSSYLSAPSHACSSARYLLPRRHFFTSLRSDRISMQHSLKRACNEHDQSVPSKRIHPNGGLQPPIVF